MTDDGSSMYAGYYGVTISNDKGWTANQIVDVVGALQDMANAFSQTIGGTPMQAIQSAFNTYDKKILLTRDPDHKVTGGAYGWAWDSYTIHFRQFYGVSELDKRLICHEFGHIFDYNTFGEAGKNGEAGRILDNLQENFAGFPNRQSESTPPHGFYAGMNDWQFSPDSGAGEEIADMFVGYVYGKFAEDQAGNVTLPGAMRSSLMTSLVQTFVHSK